MIMKCSVGEAVLKQYNPVGAAITGTETSKVNVKRIVDTVLITNLPEFASGLLV
jgi:hypothetical protein